MTETLQCECGQRVQQRVDFISPAYVVTFTDPATTTLILACPGCSRPLYAALRDRSEEHTSELQSLMRISYAVFRLQKNNKTLYIINDLLNILRQQTDHN